MDELELLRKLPTLEKREWSFLETIGVSQRETIMANLLAYFFNPCKPHGLEDTFIKALLQTKPYYLNKKEKIEINNREKERDKYQIKLNQLKRFTNSDYSFDWANTIVEDSTDKNKRIDIVVESTDLIIAIEFKINHHLDNPLGNYFKHIEFSEKEGKRVVNKKYKGKQKYYVVLTPNWKEPEGKAKGNEEFVQITLAGFIGNVKKNVSEKENFKRREDSHQFYIYNDFINTIENRGKEISMINKYFEIFNKKNEDNKQIEESYRNLSKIKDAIEKRVIEISEYNNLKFRLLLSKETIQSALMRTKENKTQIKIRLSLKGWYGERWPYEQGKNKHDINSDEYLGSYRDKTDNIKNMILKYYNKH